MTGAPWDRCERWPDDCPAGPCTADFGCRVVELPWTWRDYAVVAVAVLVAGALFVVMVLGLLWLPELVALVMHAAGR